MPKLAPFTMSNFETMELDRLLEPLDDKSKAMVYDVFEEWHERVKTQAVESAKRSTKDEVLRLVVEYA